MTKKPIYESPSAEIIELRIQNSILDVSYVGNYINPAELDEWEGEDL